MAEINLRSDDPNQFKAIFGDARQRVSVKMLRYEIVLPTYSAGRWKKLPSQREALENNAIFTREVRNLFTLLSAYEDQGNALPLSLEIKVASPMDSYQPPATSTVNEGTGLERNNNTYINIEMPEFDALPSLAKVVELRNFGGRDLHPSTLGIMLWALPAIEKIFWQINGPEVRFIELRRDIRSSLARALLNTAATSLRELEIYWEDSDCRNHSHDAGSLVNPETGVDELSVALGKIAQSPAIRVLRLTGQFILSDEIFQPAATGSIDSPTMWPSLECIKLDLSTMTPNGMWYYTGDPNSVEISEERQYDSEEEEEFIDSSNSDTSDYPAVWDWQRLNGQRPLHTWRNRPDPATLNPFLLKLALAVPKMPALRRIEISMRNMSGFTFEAEYLAATEKGSLSRIPDTDLARFDESHRNGPRWEIVLSNVGSSMSETRAEWEIPEDLKEAWRNCTDPDEGGVIVLNGGSWLKREPF